MERLTRQIALVALFTALLDGGSLLGVGGDGISPTQTFGVAGFVLMGSLTISRLFAAVGMWIHSSWGTALLFLTTLTELIIFAAPNMTLDIGVIGLVLRLALFLGSATLLLFAMRAWRRSVHD